MAVITLDDLIIEYDTSRPILSLMIRKMGDVTTGDYLSIGMDSKEVMWNIIKKNTVGSGYNTCVLWVIVNTSIGKKILIDFVKNMAEYVDDNCKKEPNICELKIANKYTVRFVPEFLLKMLTISIDGEEPEMYDSDVNKFAMEAMAFGRSEDGTHGVVAVIIRCITTGDLIYIDSLFPESSSLVVEDPNGDMEMLLTTCVGIKRKYKSIEGGTAMSLFVENEPMIKKEVFVVMNDRILMYNLPFKGEVIQYRLKEDATSDQILKVIDKAQVDGALLAQSYDGLELDGEELPVESAEVCVTEAIIGYVSGDNIMNVVVSTPDGMKLYLETYAESVTFAHDECVKNAYSIMLRSKKTGDVVYYFADSSNFDHYHFIYQTAC